MPRLRVLGLLALATMIGLTACSSPPVPTPSASAVVSDGAATPAADGFSSAPPEPRYDFDCASLLAEFGSILPGATVQDPRAESGSRLNLLTADAVLTQGGVACLISNGVSPSTPERDPSFVGLEFFLLPDAADAYASVSAAWDLSELGRTPTQDHVVCPVHRLYGETYVSALLRTHDASNEYVACQALRAYADGLSGTTPADPAPRDGEVSAVGGCASLLTDEDILALSGAALGTDSWFEYVWDDAIGDAAQLVSGVPLCNWDDGSSTNGVSIRPLVGGAWVAPTWSAGPNREPLAIDAARRGDAAWVDYDPAYPNSAHLLVVSGGSAFDVQTWIPGDQVENARRVAQALVDRLADGG